MATHSYDILPELQAYLRSRFTPLSPSLGPDEPVAIPRSAASTVLLRDDPSGLQTYVLQRHARMAFAPRMSVFPGGGVDVSDEATPDRWLSCAVREAEEETGVRLDPGELWPWARWVTPTISPLRYDTMFYLTRCPVDQSPADVSGEADSVRWWGVRSLLAAYELEIVSMLPPTVSILLELARHETVADALGAAAGRVVATVLPEVDLDEQGAVVGFRYPSPGPGPS